MLDKIWRFLKQLIQQLFGTNPKIEPRHPQLRPTLTDAEYEAKFMELLEGVNQGWGRDDVAGFLIAKRIKNGDLAAWLRRFGVRLLEGAQGSTEGGHGGTAPTNAVVSLQELARRLELLGGVVGGELGEVAGNVGREILVEFPVVSGEGGEDVDGEAIDIQSSFDKFNKALETKVDDSDLWYHLGFKLHNLGRLSEAIDFYDKSLEIKPDIEAWNNRGLALYSLGRLKEAITSYDKALEIEPDYHEAWNNLGSALDKLGRLEDALAHHKKAL